MATEAKASTGALMAGICVGALILFVWFQDLVLLSNLRGSDAAGNALAQAYAAIALIIVWVLLGVLVLIAWFKGLMPEWAGLAALILVPVSGLVAIMAADLLARPHEQPYLWPLIIPAAVPPLVMMFSFWALIPSMRVAIPQT